MALSIKPLRAHRQESEFNIDIVESSWRHTNDVDDTLIIFATLDDNDVRNTSHPEYSEKTETEESSVATAQKFTDGSRHRAITVELQGMDFKDARTSNSFVHTWEKMLLIVTHEPLEKARRPL